MATSTIIEVPSPSTRSSYHHFYQDTVAATPRNSFLYSSAATAQRLLESRRNFLNSCSSGGSDGHKVEQQEVSCGVRTKRPATKKISFKIKKTPSLLYKMPTNPNNNNNSSKVAELTMKFNKISEKSGRVTRKPSVKTKPHEEVLKIRRVIRSSSQHYARAKIGTPATRPSTLELPSPSSVKEAIKIFEEHKTIIGEVPKKPQVPDKKSVLEKICRISTGEEKVPERVSPMVPPKPNTSFLWSINQDKTPSPSAPLEPAYDLIDYSPQPIIVEEEQIEDNPSEEQQEEEKIYEELSEYQKYEVTEDGYEICDNKIDLPPLPPKNKQPALPPRPPSITVVNTTSDTISNCYESIYNPDSTNTNNCYESIYGCRFYNGSSNRNSIVSSDQQSNSLYGGESLLMMGWGVDMAANSGDGLGLYDGNRKGTSDLSTGSSSSDWVDMSDAEETCKNTNGIIVVRGKQKGKRAGWSKKIREQWTKSPRKVPHIDQGNESDSDHHYESLYTASDVITKNTTARDDCHDDDYDSFDSDTESENSFVRVHLNDSGVDIGNNQLPDPPNQQQTYVLTRLAATAGKHMRKLRRNWSLTKNDITKSLSRMTKKRKSRTDLTQTSPDDTNEDNKDKKSDASDYVTTAKSSPESNHYESDKVKGLLNKFRRSMSLSAESASDLTSNLGNKPKSTFYLTDIDIEDNSEDVDSGAASLSPAVQRSSISSTNKITRPHSPPPVPPTTKRATSWYAEVGLFKNDANKIRPNTTCWYAEVGLYQSNSTPSTSSAENSTEYYNNLNNTTDDLSSCYYNNQSIGSNKSDSVDNIQLRLQDEPLYQFYDAAVLESVCHDGILDENYEEVVARSPSTRPSLMDLVTPSRSLWCEIPEVLHSCVLSTLSTHQQKLQEAKFEMLTSEASYLKSMSVLTNHFMAQINTEVFDTLFGRVQPVKQCSEKLLIDLEKCWQDNVFLHGICDLVHKHAEENFHVYVTYCENQITIDETLKSRDKTFQDQLRQLEQSPVCQNLTLHSFLMLPMQRITRWPLLMDAVLKRLSPQDPEYITCQMALTTLNRIVSQCNEAARHQERANEMKKISASLEFAKGVPPVRIVQPGRYLVRSGNVVHLQQRSEDNIKLTFGKKFTKSTLTLFLFNDLLLVAKAKGGDSCYSVLHYCPRSLVELNSSKEGDVVSLPTRDVQGRNLLFLVLLENQNEKTVQLLISCNSESDRERWIEALTPPKSEDPDETLYECWDCPQVTAVHSYTTSQPDELALSRGDVINVLRKMTDGWFHGERIRDGSTGWFPANYTVEIANPHVRSRNLKQRHRLLAFSETYLKIATK